MSRYVQCQRDFVLATKNALRTNSAADAMNLERARLTIEMVLENAVLGPVVKALLT